MSVQGLAAAQAKTGVGRQSWDLILVLLRLAALAVLVLLAVSPWRLPYPLTDSAVFQWVGDRLRLGEVPYRDWFDHKPPLIYFINALGLNLGRGSSWGVWALEVVSLTAAAAVAWGWLGRVFSRRTAWLAVTILLVQVPFVLDGGNLTEEYGLPFQFLAYSLLTGLLSGTARRSRLSLFLLGLTVGVLSSLKPNLVFGLLVLVFLAFETRRRPLWQVLGQLAVFAVGVGGIWLIWLVYFGLQGALAEFWRAVIVYNRGMNDLPAALATGLWINLASIARQSIWFVFGPFLWLAGLLALKRLRAGSGAEPPAKLAWAACLIAGIDFPITLLAMNLTGNGFLHYLLPVVPALTVLTAATVFLLEGRWLKLHWQRLPQIFVLLLVGAALLNGLVSLGMAYLTPADQSTGLLAGWVRQHSTADARILQWGMETGVYRASERMAASAVFFALPLFTPNPVSAELTGQLLADLKADPPELILDSISPVWPLLRPTAGQPCALAGNPDWINRQVDERYRAVTEKLAEINLPATPVTARPVIHPAMGELYRWVCQNYHYEANIPGSFWQVYRKNPNL